MSRLRATLRAVLIACIAIYVAIVLLLFFSQRSLIFPAPVHRGEPTMRGAQLLRLPLSSLGEAIALHFEAPEGAPTLVYFHGNGEDLARVAKTFTKLTTHQVGLLLIEYPGYGLMRAMPVSEENIYRVAEAFVTHARESLNVSNDRMVLVGRSLGCAVAVEMAARGHGARMVLLSPFTSLADVASREYPYVPVRLLLRDRFDNLSKAPRVAIPTLVVHGSEDDLIPVDLAERLSRAFTRARFELLVGRDHNDIWEDESLSEKVAAFAKQ